MDEQFFVQILLCKTKSENNCLAVFFNHKKLFRYLRETVVNMNNFFPEVKKLGIWYSKKNIYLKNVHKKNIQYRKTLKIILKEKMPVYQSLN